MYPSSPLKLNHHYRCSFYIDDKTVDTQPWGFIQQDNKPLQDGYPYETYGNMIIIEDAQLDNIKYYEPGIKWYIFLDSCYNVKKILYKGQYYDQIVKDVIKGDQILKVIKKLGLTREVKAKREPKLVKITDGVKLLSRMLRECPQVEIEGTYTKQPTYYNKFRYVSRNLTETMRIKEKSVTGSKIEKELWYRPDSIYQYRALCLMQSYTTTFNSCQYLSAHQLTVETILDLLSQGLHLLDIDMDDSYETYQDQDFHLVDRYFQLNPDGTVLRRFNVYPMDDDSPARANNYYNCTHQDVLVDGELIEAYDPRTCSAYPPSQVVTYFNI